MMNYMMEIAMKIVMECVMECVSVMCANINFKSYNINFVKVPNHE